MIFYLYILKSIFAVNFEEIENDFPVGLNFTYQVTFRNFQIIIFSFRISFFDGTSIIRTYTSYFSLNIQKVKIIKYLLIKEYSDFVYVINLLNLAALIGFNESPTFKKAESILVWPKKNEKVELNRIRGTNFTKGQVLWKLREFRIHQKSVFAVLRRKLQCSSCKDLSKPVFLLWKILSVENGKIKNSDLIDFRSRRMEMLNNDFEVRALKFTIESQENKYFVIVLK